jgi:hypothetical protein
VGIVDGEVRVIRAQVQSREVASSHTLHSFSPANSELATTANTTLSRRERLIEATVEAVSEGSVDRLHRTRDSQEAQ